MLIDLTGRRFGQVTVVGRSTTVRGAHPRWDCRCDCGTTWDVSGPQLRIGDTKSCGCTKGSRISAARTTHGIRSGHPHRPIYNTWKNMKARCLNPKNTAFCDYGERGISICTRWVDSFEAFFEDMGATWAPGLSIERKDNNGNYTPDNCVWADDFIQANNTRKNRVIETPEGEMTVAQASRKFGPSPTAFRARFYRGKTGLELFA